MTQTKIFDIDSAINTVVRASKKAIEDRKTTIFITVVLINVFLWGVVINNQKTLDASNQDLKDENKLLKVTTSIADKKIGVIEYRINELSNKFKQPTKREKPNE